MYFFTLSMYNAANYLLAGFSVFNEFSLCRPLPGGVALKSLFQEHP
jgi:hypothetical protein